MNTVGNWVEQAAPSSQLHSVLSSVWSFLLPVEHAQKSTLTQFTVGALQNMAHAVAWFLLFGIVVYAVSLSRAGRPGVKRFSYAHLDTEPGETFSLREAWNYLLPPGFYKHPSFRFDMLWLPFSIVLNFLGLLGVTMGPGLVQGWLVKQFGHSAVTLPENGLTITLQVVLVILARDFGRFMWHWQGHVSPFFWEFHKGHHSAEVLHPFGVRTHPVDMFIRNTYTGVGSGLIAGGLIYALGMNYSLTTVYAVTVCMAIFGVLEIFEHTHIRVSFGKTLNRIFYAPFMHHFHHGARLEHMNVNLGITGGLTLWDYLFRTLYWPKETENIVWGASMEELGDKNPHRTLKGFLVGPFVEAFRTLRRNKANGLAAPAANTAA